jgi:hypothetical protein
LGWVQVAYRNRCRCFGWCGCFTWWWQGLCRSQPAALELVGSAAEAAARIAHRRNAVARHAHPRADRERSICWSECTRWAAPGGRRDACRCASAAACSASAVGPRT